VRRSRGGNARKHKRELTDATFLSVLSGDDDADGVSSPSGGVGAGAAVHDAHDEEDDTDVPGAAKAAAYEQGLAPINGFVFARYKLGTITCTSCHCELMYYQDRELLRGGFTFRCRVCQALQSLTLQEE
jgi:hypothetical protein